MGTLELELRMLRALRSEPRSAKFFTSYEYFGPVGMMHKVAAMHLEKMAETGYLRKSKGRYSITPAGLDFLKYRGKMPGRLAAPPVLNNYTSRATYTPPVWGAVRPGATDFLACRSLAFRGKEKC